MLEKVDRMKAKQIHEGMREPRGRGFESRCRLRIFSFRVALVRSCRISTLHKFDLQHLILVSSVYMSDVPK